MVRCGRVRTTTRRNASMASTLTASQRSRTPNSPAAGSGRSQHWACCPLGERLPTHCYGLDRSNGQSVGSERNAALRGAGGPDHRRARCPADRHGPRQQPRQPDAQPDPVRPHRRDPERDPRRRGGAPPADPEERPGAQGATDLRRHRRDRRPRAGGGARRCRRDHRRDAARRPGVPGAPLARRGRRPSQPGPAATVAARAARRGTVRRAGGCRVAVADGARLAGRRRLPEWRLPRGGARIRRAAGLSRRRDRWLALVAWRVGSRAGDPRSRIGGWLGRHDPG